MIILNGNYGEGGGQILRTALAYSTILQKAFEINDIRKGRENPGLKNQHLYCIKALRKFCDSAAEGDELGSLSLKYWPKKFIGRNVEIDVETAGSITLLMQSVLLPSMFAGKPFTITLIGGTDVSWSPSFDYFNNVLLPQLQRFCRIEARILKRGYYPKGNGKIEIKFNQSFKLIDFDSFGGFVEKLSGSVPKYDLTEQHNLIQIKGISHASKDLQQARVSERQSHSAQKTLARKFNVPISIKSEYHDTLSIGSGITLWAIFSKRRDDIDEKNPIRIGSDSLGERGKKAETVGEECAMELIKEMESKAPADRHLADQLLPFMALLPGSKIRTSEITQHSLTNIYTIEQFLGKKFEVDGDIISVL